MSSGPCARNQKKQWVPIVLLALWVPTLGSGVRVLLRYAHTPGHPATPPDRWPRTAPIPASPHDSTLVLFVHPQCPCSRSTIGELEQIVACCGSKVDVNVFFYAPPGQNRDWPRTDLWQSTARIPGVHLMEDSNGVTARLFGARTSGQALLYDRSRRLVFSGGITAFRGHSGSNDGREAIIALLLDRISRHQNSPVFGCALFGEN
jgi:hypothetical protein